MTQKIMQPFKDRVLFFRLKSGDKEAFGKIYDLYVDQIYRFIYFKVSAKETAEDLTSETFLKIWDYVNKEENREIGNPKALLYKIAHGLVVNFYRQNSVQKTVGLGEEIGQLAGQTNLPEAMALKDEKQQIEKALSHLKDEYRDAVILKYIEDFSIREIAKILDKTPGAVRVLIHRALKVLKEILEEKTNE